MLLIIVRHGEAEPKSSAKRDGDRGLTEKGSCALKKNLEIGRALVGDGKVDWILSSPLLRARQSADIAREIFHGPVSEVSTSLVSESEPYEVYQALSRLQSLNLAIIVTHQPLIGRLLAQLLNWNDRNFQFGTGALAIVEVKEMRVNPEGTLLCLIQSLG